MSDLIIIGASTRAAAMSAWRAGWRPWCADLFADRDLARIAAVCKVSANNYPDNLLDALKDAPDGPVMYTGGLENWPDLLERIERPLFGNPANVVRAIRKPQKWTACLQGHHLPCPKIADTPVAAGQWLLKPRRGAGGLGIRVHDGQRFNARTHFLQERIDGLPCSAVFLAKDDGTIFLGATKQLIGVSWLNATGFLYAGSVGPLVVADAEPYWREIGTALAWTFKLRGVFGVDAVMHNGAPWPIEINPRYTASVEIMERGGGHALPEPVDATLRFGHPGRIGGCFRAKAILFARATFAFPADGPWLDALADGVDLDEAEYADIPHAGEIIEQGRPVLTIFASAQSVAECEGNLQEKAQALDRRLWG